MSSPAATRAAHRARARRRAACEAAGHPDRTVEGRCETCRYWVGVVQTMPAAPPTVTQALSEVRFWRVLMEERRRTVIVSTTNELRARTWISARGLATLITVATTPWMDDSTMIVIDQAEFDTALADSLDAYQPTIGPVGVASYTTGTRDSSIDCALPEGDQ